MPKKPLARLKKKDPASTGGSTKIKKNSQPTFGSLEIIPHGTRIHVISQSGQWAVKRDGTSRASKVYKDKQFAINYAVSLARKNSIKDVVIHKNDGTIESWEKAPYAER